MSCDEEYKPPTKLEYRQMKNAEARANRRKRPLQSWLRNDFIYHHRNRFRNPCRVAEVVVTSTKRVPADRRSLMTRMFGTSTAATLRAAKSAILGLKDVGVPVIRKPTAKERAKYAMKRLGS